MSEITAGVDATRLMVRLNLNAALPEFLGLIADAYGDDPATVGQLLMDLSERRVHLEDALQGGDFRALSESLVEHAVEGVDTATEALAGVLLEQCTLALDYRQAMDLAAEVAAAAGKTTSGQRHLQAAS